MDFFKDKSQSIYLRKIEVHHSNFFKNKHPVNECKTLNSDMLKSVQITYFGPFTKLVEINKVLKEQNQTLKEQIEALNKMLLKEKKCEH